MQNAVSSGEINEEMRDLVHQAENWVKEQGFNRVPEISARELRTHNLMNDILTRASLMLMQQMGIDSVEGFVKEEKERETILANIKTEEDKEKGSPVSSPMAMEEFRNRMQNARGSPCTPRTRSALMAEYFPVDKIDLAEKEEAMKQTFIIPKNPRKSSLALEPLFTSTPISKTPRRSSGVASGAVKKVPQEGDMTPFENRASRLRRQKLEESRSSFTSSLNSSFSKWK